VLTDRENAPGARRGPAGDPARAIGDPFDVGALIAQVRRHLGGHDRAGRGAAV
jgi:hypothetical protein